MYTPQPLGNFLLLVPLPLGISIDLPWGGGGGGGYGYFLEPHNLSNSWNTRGLQWVKPLRLSCLIRFIFRVKGQPNTIIMLCNFQVTLHSRHLQILTCRVKFGASTAITTTLFTSAFTSWLTGAFDLYLA